MNHVFEISLSKLFTWISSVLLLLFAQTPFASESTDPDTACSFLKQERFRGMMEYSQKKSGIYSCTSLRKPVNKGEPIGSDIRYEVRGVKTRANTLLLHLSMRAHRSSVPVLREFHKYANIIYREIFQTSLSEEITQAIFSAVRGEWLVNGHKIMLDRLHDKAMTYELIFTIEQ